jgi:hypothetical protein
MVNVGLSVCKLLESNAGISLQEPMTLENRFRAHSTRIRLRVRENAKYQAECATFAASNWGRQAFKTSFSTKLLSIHPPLFISNSSATEAGTCADARSE